MTEQELPAKAQELLNLAEDHGWIFTASWHTNGWDEQFVNVIVGRSLAARERDAYRSDGYHGNGWAFTLTWHSRDAAPGKLRLFRKALGRTPEHPQYADYTLKYVRSIITDHPDPDHRRPVE